MVIYQKEDKVKDPSPPACTCPEDVCHGLYEGEGRPLCMKAYREMYELTDLLKKI